jgi:hypothetical protein
VGSPSAGGWLVGCGGVQELRSSLCKIQQAIKVQKFWDGAFLIIDIVRLSSALVVLDHFVELGSSFSFCGFSFLLCVVEENFKAEKQSRFEIVFDRISFCLCRNLRWGRIKGLMMVMDMWIIWRILSTNS